MYEHIKAQLQQRIDAQQPAIAQAQAIEQTWRANVDAAATTLTTAQNNAAGAQQALDALNAAVAAAQERVDAADPHLQKADQAVADWAATEPDTELPDGRPNPQWGAWHRKLLALQDRADAARADLAAAQGALRDAAAQRDQGAAALAAAHARVADAQVALADSQDGLATAGQDLAAQQAFVQSLVGEGPRLDARAARILAQPLDRDDVNALADDELAEALALRSQRQQLRQERVNIVAQRATTLAAYDATADDLAVVAASINGWPDAGLHPDLAAITGGLDALADGSRTQRSRPADTRTDDLHAATATLNDLVSRMQTIVDAATVERDAASAALTQDASDLADLKAAAPKR